VSVIIPSFESARTIRACLASVLAQDIDTPFEVFVADSGTDSTAEIVRREFPTVRLLKSKTRWSAEAARNRAAGEASGTLLAFIDSDCEAARDWLRRMCAVLERDGYDGVGGAIRPVDGSNATAWAGYFCEFREFLPRGQAADATYLTPNNAAYRADIFRRVGGFPDGYFPLEDQVLYDRLRVFGARVRFDPTIVMTHNHRTEVRAFVSHQTRIGHSNARVVRAIKAQGAWLASHRPVMIPLLPALVAYRFARTVAACWRQERFLMLRRPRVAALCWLGMCGWAIGFLRGSIGDSGGQRVSARA